MATETTAPLTPSDAVRAFYAEELAAGTLSEADLGRLQAIAEEKGHDLLDWAKDDAIPELRDSAVDFVDGARDHLDNLKAAEADGVMTGAEFAEDGLPVMDGVFDIVETVHDVGADGAILIVQGDREIIDARAEMDGADPAVIQAQREKLDDQESFINEFHNWRNQQVDQARDFMEAHRADIEAVPDVRQLPQPHEGDAPVDHSDQSVAAHTEMADAGAEA